MGKAPLYVRALTDAEREALEAALRSAAAFVLRRAQILLASARGEQAGAIAVLVGFSGQAVRQMIHAFHQQGLEVLQRRSTRSPTLHYCFDTAAERLREILHQSPRSSGQETSVGTLELAAEVAFAQGLTAWRVSDETVRATLARMGVRLQRAKHGISSPDPEYARKKAQRDRLIRLAERNEDLLLGFLDESGGVGWPVRTGSLGRTAGSPCGWSSRRSRALIRIPRPWPATACWPAPGRPTASAATPCGGASSRAARSA